MELVEHLGKELLAQAGLAIPRGIVVRSADDALLAATELGSPVVVKSQVLAGKRGKLGGIRFAASASHARTAAEDLLGRVVADCPVDALLIERQADIRHELFAAVLNDAESKAPLVLFSAAGGADIEQAHAAAPGAVLRRVVDVRHGFTAEDAAAMVSAGTDLDVAVVERVAAAMAAIYRVYREFDAERIEVNPLAVTTGGEVLALDCKLSLDPAARRRHEPLFAAAEAAVPPVGTALERRGREEGLLFIELDGSVGVLANGAGLAMTTLDSVAHHGGKAANFLEIGGDAYTKAAPAVNLVLSNPNVRSLLVNFCGAFARTDVMTAGVVAAIEQLQVDLPMSFSIHGTGEREAIAILRDRLGLSPHELMDDAVKEAVLAATGGAS